MVDFAIDYATAPALAAARARTLELLDTVGVALARLAPCQLETIAVAGSLGRLEATAYSDFDCLMIARDGAPAPAVADEVAAVMAVFAAAGLRLPKASGIYRDATPRALLLEPAARGSLRETPTVFGQRMQVLLDARPVYAPAHFAQLRSDILRWYGSGSFADDGRQGWTFLLHELQRYVHAYSGWQQYLLTRSKDDSWELRQAKLAGSRLVTSAGLLLLLGHSNHRVDKLAWLDLQLAATPLERIGRVMTDCGADGFAVVLDAYETLHARLADGAARAALLAGGPDESAGFARPASPAFAALTAPATALRMALTTFLAERWGRWDPRFFAHLWW